MSAKEEFCSIGLLSFALNGNPNMAVGECGKVLADIIRENYPDRLPTFSYDDNGIIMHFNDHPDTTFEDVERVFEKAEVAWDERI